MDKVIDSDIGEQLREVLEERALVAGLADPSANDEVRRRMEESRARRLQPWFVHDFFTEALRLYGGRIAGREHGRYEVTRVPAAVRSSADPALGPVHDRYARVTFDKNHVLLDAEMAGKLSGGAGDRAELISPGSALLSAVASQSARRLG